MAVRKFSEIANNASIAFAPASDVLRIDSLVLSAADFTVSAPTAGTTKFIGGGKTFTLQTATGKLTTTNVKFDDGSRLVVGDNATGTANDGANNVLTGSAHDDQLLGLGGRDTLNGGDGADLLNGGTGVDRLVGGKGSDTYIVDNVADVVVEDSVAGSGAQDLVKSSVSYVIADVDVENLTLTGTAANGTGNTRGNAIEGNGEDNHLQGLAGNDVLAGRGGMDLLEGGGGDDILAYDAQDQIEGGGGTDTLKVSAATLDLAGRAGDELLSIEVIELAHAAGSLTLTKDDVLAVSSTGTLRVMGGAGDSLHAAGVWIQQDDVEIGGQLYAVYTKGDATLQVTWAMDRSGIGLPVAEISLSGLDGANGFRLDGIAADDYSGFSVASAGDVNGDGFDDLIIGAYYAESGAGETYVVFGKASGFASALNLSTLNGANGFRIDGIDADDYSGQSVASAGDVNGDGFADLIVGAPWADADGDSSAGESYVVFGKASGFASALNLSSLNGANGFRLDGIDAGDRSGISVASAGDLNGDGFDDLIIGADLAADWVGETYVVFGAASGLGSALDLSALDGSNGFRLDGVDLNSFSGGSVASAGDVNGDGYGDVIIGATHADPGGTENADAGESYVVFGAASGFASALDLATLNGSNGFRVQGIEVGDHSGISVASAGDVNGDGFDDLIIGAWGADPGGDDSAGESYVVFGAASGFGATLDLASLDGTNGFRLDGIDPSDSSGVSAASAGDVNGDGFDDLVIGAYLADSGAGTYSGETYVVFGAAAFGSALDLGSLDGTNGFKLSGIAEGDYSGRSVASAGDVNGDGFDDLVIGAYHAALVAGESYVIFGGELTVDIGYVGSRGADTLTGTGGAEVFRGGRGGDRIEVADLDFFRVDGGTGTDTLALIGDGLTLDFSALDANAVRGIEAIDLGGGGNVLAIGVLDVLNLSDASNVLRVEGDASDTVDLSADAWTLDQENVGGYDYYVLGAATVRVAVAVGVDLGT